MYDADKVIEYITGNWDDWKEARADKERRWTDCINNYLCYIDESKYDNWPWRSKAPDTFSQEIGDAISAALRNGVFPMNEDFYMLDGIDDLGKAYAPFVKQVLDNYIHKSKFIPRTKPWFKQLAVIGNAPFIIPWVTKTRTHKKRKRKYDGSVAVVDNVKLLYDGFIFETLDAFDVVFDPTKIYIDESPIIRRYYKSKAELVEYADLYQNLDQLEDGYATEDEKSTAAKAQRATVFGLRNEPPEDKIELLEIWGDMEIDGVIYRDYVGIVANRKVLLRFEENPYWGGRPIMWQTYESNWFTAYGMGALEPLIGVHNLINTFTNQKSDVLNLIINGTFKAVDDGVLDPDQAVMRPGGIIQVGDINNLQALHPNTNVALAFQEINQLRLRGEYSSGASSYEKGAVPSGKRTAYEANIIKQGSSTRFNDILKHIGDTSIEYILNHYLESYFQFGYNKFELPEAAFYGEYKIQYTGADTAAVKNYEIQQMMMLMDIVGRSEIFAGAIEPTEFLDEMRKRLTLNNPKLVKSKEEYQKFMQSRQAQANGGGLQPLELPNPDEGLINSGGVSYE